MAETTVNDAPKPQLSEKAKAAQAEAERIAAQAEAERDRKLAAIKDQKTDSDKEKVPGLWVRYVNPNLGDPEFEDIFGYTLQRGGDYVMMKLPYDQAHALKQNPMFETVFVEDASGIDDGDTKAAEADDQPRAKRRVGKN